MKPFNWIAAIALGTLVASATPAIAQDAAGKPATTPPAGGPGGAPGARGERMQKVMDDLNLTDEQKQKLQTIRQEQGPKMREIWQNNDLTPEQKREKMKPLQEAMNTKVKEILTPEQFEKWQKIQQNVAPRGGRGPGGAAGVRPAPAAK